MRLRPRLTYANVVSTGCLFVTLGGTAWAVTASSVGSAQLKKDAVATRKIAPEAVTGRKLIPLDPRVVVLPIDTDNPCGPKRSGRFCADWRNYGRGFAPAAYYRDRSGVVHLEGSVETGDGAPVPPDLTLFYLPRSYRPKDGARTVRGVTVREDGSVDANEPAARLALDGIAFTP